MKTRKDKEKLQTELAQKAGDQKIMIFSNMKGISVLKQQALRRALRAEHAEYKIAKKTIIRRALSEKGLPFPVESFKGEVGVIFGFGDEVAPAKVLAKFRRQNPEGFEMLSGILGDRALTKEDVIRLSKLPGKQELLGQLVGVLSAPMRGLMAVLNGNQRKLVVALAEIAKKK